MEPPAVKLLATCSFLHGRPCNVITSAATTKLCLPAPLAPAGMVYPGAAAGGMPYGMVMQPYGYVPIRPGQVRAASASLLLWAPWQAVLHLCKPGWGALLKGCEGQGRAAHTAGRTMLPPRPMSTPAPHVPPSRGPASLLTGLLSPCHPLRLPLQEAMMQAYAASMQMAYAPYGSPGTAGMAMPVSPVSGMQNPLSPTGSGPLGRRPSGSSRYSGGRGGGGGGQRSAAATPRADSLSQDRQQAPAAAAAAAVAAAQAAQQPAAQQPAAQQPAAQQQPQQQPQQQEQPSGAA